MNPPEGLEQMCSVAAGNMFATNYSRAPQLLPNSRSLGEKSVYRRSEISSHERGIIIINDADRKRALREIFGSFQRLFCKYGATLRLISIKAERPMCLRRDFRDV